MDSDKPWVTFVIPTYNRAALIGTAIQSVMNQDHPSWELIIVDDGSTDDTERVVQRFEDSRIKYIKTVNQERGVARNTGVSMARGRFVSFIDSDDYILEHTVTKAIHCLEQNPNWDIFHFGFEVRSENGRLWRKQILCLL